MWSGLLPTPLSDAMLTVTSADGSHLCSALELLYAGLPEIERQAQIARISQEIACGHLAAQDVLLAEVDGVAVGAMLVVIGECGTGLVFAPVLALANLKPSECSARRRGINATAVEDALLTAATRRLDATKAWIGQVLLEQNQSREQAAVLRHGFSHLTDIRFYERSIDKRPHGRGQPSATLPALTSVRFRRGANHLRFANVIDQSYRDSLDCPELNGRRSGSESLKQHALVGNFRSDMWRLYRQGREDVGVLLIVERADQPVWEIVYLGVVPSARRHGVAKRMLDDAVASAEAVGVKQILVAVDVRNKPARHLYESTGFVPTDTRRAFVRFPSRPRRS